MTLGGLYFLSVAISGVVQLLINQAAKDTIERSGKEVDFSNLSAFEIIRYFVQDYGFTFVPVYNLIKSIIINVIKTKPHEYALKRLNTFNNRNMIIDVKKEDVKKEEKQKELPPRKEQNTEKALPPRKEQNITKPLPPRKEQDLNRPLPDVKKPAFKSREEELSFYKSEFNKLKTEYENSHDLPYEVRKAMYNKLFNYKNHIDALKRYIAKNKEIENMKMELQTIESNLNNEQKLELN